MIWNQARILAELRRLHALGRDLSYNRMARSNQSLVSAAAYHFSSYRQAIKAAGIDYADVLRRPRWTRQRIISILRGAHRAGKKLNWASVIVRRDELGKAAFASLQPRLFGSWHQALLSAGLHPSGISRYQRWDAAEILRQIRTRKRRGQALSSGAMQHSAAALHAAALRHFGSHCAALRAAGLNADRFRLRQRWDRNLVIRLLREADRKGQRMSDGSIRRHRPALYGAALRWFGSFRAARKAAGITSPKRLRGHKPARSR